jgi:hypothetical protein
MAGENNWCRVLRGRSMGSVARDEVVGCNANRNAHHLAAMSRFEVAMLLRLTVFCPKEGLK